MKNKILVSIIIPVKNGLLWLEKSLPIFLKQKIEGNIEVILLNSNSSDGLKEYLAKANFNNVFLYEIKPSSFNHGATRNLGVKLAKGEFVVFTVQDAIPTNENWIDEMLKVMTNKNVMAVCGQQIVPHHKDKNPIEWFRPQTKATIKLIEPLKINFNTISLNKKQNFNSWDNVNACYRKTALTETPFLPVTFGEDMCWANEALTKGYTLAYSSFAQVEHYHHQTINFSINRALSEWWIKYKLYGIEPEMQVTNLVLQILKWLRILYKSIPFSLFKYSMWLKYNYTINKAEKKAYYIWKKNSDSNNLNALGKKIEQKVPIATRSI